MAEWSELSSGFSAGRTKTSFRFAVSSGTEASIAHRLIFVRHWARTSQASIGVCSASARSWSNTLAFACSLTRRLKASHYDERMSAIT